MLGIIERCGDILLKQSLGWFISSFSTDPVFFLFSPIKIKNASVQGGPASNFTAEPLFDRRSGRGEDGRPTSSGSSSVSNMTRGVMYFNMLAFPGERL